MYPTEASILGLSSDDLAIITSVRLLIGDERKTIIEEVEDGSNCGNILVDGSVYQMENKGWPRKIVVSGVEYTDPYNPSVDNYEYLVFSGTEVLDGKISLIYESFRFSDAEILNAYDFAAGSVLAAQCNLTAEQLTPALINLATSVVLIQGEFQRYVEEAVEMQDNGSVIDLVDRLDFLQKELSDLRDRLERAIKEKIKCAGFSLPVIRVE